jgi:hypothetical protein
MLGMALNLYIGWEKHELQAELRRAQEDLAAGKTIVDTNTGDVSKGEQVEASAITRIRQILRALNALDPANYPADQITPRNRTKATFDFSYAEQT